ncbi:MAG: SelB C-terminal domain-containing protein, partial [Firmicutes bacterium]|nr:SelB C-terminal domain-containing protein [Bacillota bacterium]
ALAARATAGIDARLVELLEHSAHQTVAQAALALGEAEAVTSAAWQRLRAREQFAVLASPGGEVLKTVIERWRRELAAAARGYYELHPHDIWLPRGVVASALAAQGATAAEIDALVAEAVADGDFEKSGDRLKLARRKVVLRGLEALAYDKVQAVLRESSWDPPTLKELPDKVALRPAHVKLALHVLAQEDAVVAIGADLTLHADAVAQALTVARELCAAQGEFTLAQFRDRLGTSRRCAVALLEYFDRQHHTLRVGDRRVCNE